MNTPLPILRKHAEEGLQKYAALTHRDPEAVWQEAMTAQEMPESFRLFGKEFWELFSKLREAEIEYLKEKNFH